MNNILNSIGKSWNFDTFFLADCTNNHPLRTMAIFTVSKFSLDVYLPCSLAVIENFFSEMEDSYKEKPYHNCTHAADVASSILFLLTNSPVLNYMNNSETLAMIIASFGHDIGHPGLTNRFLINNKDPLARQYNDVSVLEMMHCSSIFEIMQDPVCDIMEGLEGPSWFATRRVIVECILSTDMAKHFDIVGTFRAKYKNASP